MKILHTHWWIDKHNVLIRTSLHHKSSIIFWNNFVMHQQPCNFIKTLKMHKIRNNFTTNNVNHSATKVQGVRPVTQAWVLKSDIPVGHRANTAKGHNHYWPHQDFKLYEKGKTINTHTHACTHTCMHTHTHMHACTHTHTHTHTTTHTSEKLHELFHRSQAIAQWFYHTQTQISIMRTQRFHSHGLVTT